MFPPSTPKAAGGNRSLQKRGQNLFSSTRFCDWMFSWHLPGLFLNTSNNQNSIVFISFFYNNVSEFAVCPLGKCQPPKWKAWSENSYPAIMWSTPGLPTTRKPKRCGTGRCCRLKKKGREDWEARLFGKGLRQVYCFCVAFFLCDKTHLSPQCHHLASSHHPCHIGHRSPSKVMRLLPLNFFCELKRVFPSFLCQLL